MIIASTMVRTRTREMCIRRAFAQDAGRGVELEAEVQVDGRPPGERAGHERHGCEAQDHEHEARPARNTQALEKYKHKVVLLVQILDTRVTRTTQLSWSSLQLCNCVKQVEQRTSWRAA